MPIAAPLQHQPTREPPVRTDLRAVAASLNARLAGADPATIIAAARASVPAGRIAVVSSFGNESAALLKFVADVDRSLPVLFLDTGWHFKETLSYRDELVTKLGLTDVRSLMPSPSALALEDSNRNLCFHNRDRCCAIRKVAPLASELAQFHAWINGRKRYQMGERGALPIVESDGPRLKFNPLALLTRAQIEAVFETAGLPRHPLEALGFGSVGCVPCTNRPLPGQSGRAGRWGGLEKTECGIHTAMLQTVTAQPNSSDEDR
jgi:phosphoadenosine phosphosulfate reductase